MHKINIFSKIISYSVALVKRGDITYNWGISFQPHDL